MRLLVLPSPVAHLSLLGWLSRLFQRASVQVSELRERWRRWEHRYDVIWFAIIGLLLLIYAWFLFTGSIARRH